MKIIDNIINEKENETITNALYKKYFNFYEKNCHLNLDDNFKYLDNLPKFYIDNIKNVLGRYFIITNSKDELNEYAGIHWHRDGEKNELSVLLYLTGDFNKGGELMFKKKSMKFKINSMFVFNSFILHKVNKYYGDNIRLAIKWRFQI